VALFSAVSVDKLQNISELLPVIGIKMDTTMRLLPNLTFQSASES